MTINITDQYRITTDPYNFIIQEKKEVKSGKNKGKFVWSSLTYHNRLIYALESLSGRVLRDSDVRTIDELKRLCSALTASLMIIASDSNIELKGYRNG